MGSGRGSACKCRREAIGGVKEGTERSESDQNTRDRLIEEEEVVRKARTKENESYLEHQSEAAHNDAEAPRIHPAIFSFLFRIESMVDPHSGFA